MDSVELTGTKLFSFYLSSSSWRIRIILNLKKIPYDYICIYDLKDGLDSKFYLKLNPSRLIPCLYIDGNVLTESMAIAEYLEETRKGNNKKPPKTRSNTFRHSAPPS